MGFRERLARFFRRPHRHPRIAKHYPARFRTTRSQPLSELATWIRDQLDPDSRAFDDQYGTATRWFDLGNYEPTPPDVIEAILDDLSDLPLEEWAFVDLGSGKGRVVLLAGMRPFREVVGIEKRRALHRRAERNLERFTGTLVRRPRLVCSDALEARLPEGPLALFLYNPFGADVLDAVLRRCTGRVELVAVNPPNPAWLAERGFVQVRWVEGAEDDRRWGRFARLSGDSSATEDRSSD
jgi:precorrin-6B methylase 2